MSHSGGKRFEKLQIRQNWPFRVILSHFGGKRLEVANWAKLFIPSHYEPLWWEKIGKVENQMKMSPWPKIQLFHFWGGGGTSARTKMSP